MNAIEKSHSQGSEERLVAFDEVIRLTTLSRSRIIQRPHCRPWSYPFGIDRTQFGKEGLCPEARLITPLPVSLGSLQEGEGEGTAMPLPLTLSLSRKGRGDEILGTEPV